MKYNTKWTKPSEIERKWHIIDASGQTLGRLSTVVASLLIGKGKVERVPNVDCGDFVVVINSDKIELSGRKEGQKMYYRHSGYPGGFKSRVFSDQMKINSAFVIEQAVKNMLPQNKLKDDMHKRLFVYKDVEHKQAAQQPVEYKL